MNNRVIPALLCAAAIAFTCGPHPQGTAQSLTAASATPKRRARTAKPAPVITSTLEAKVGDEVTFSLHVTNSGPKLVEVTFPSGQTHDFHVLDAGGREVWRWSRDRMFTQSLQNKQIPSGETVDYEEQMPRGDLHGAFTVVGTLRSSNHAVEQRASFTLP